MSSYQKWNPELQIWEEFFVNEKPVYPNFIFRNKLPFMKNQCPSDEDEFGKYKTNKEKSIFHIGDALEDCMTERNNLGVGIIIEKELFEGVIPLVYTDPSDKITKKASSYEVVQWRYLVDFSGKSKIAKHGKIWIWEFPLRELVDSKDIVIHNVNKV